MLGAVRLPLEYQGCVVTDTSPHIHIFHIRVVWCQPLNSKFLTRVIDNADVVQAKDIQLDVHQVIQFFHVNHGHRVI